MSEKFDIDRSVQNNCWGHDGSYSQDIHKEMNGQIAIEHIKDDMVCANDCPEWNKSNYDINKCNCYKKEVIIFVLNHIC